uniref:Uncharacterized protein n=1 Tax=Polysiphonia elongata TaxID=159753 RepID=A0A1Z1MBF5_9FLOR|nr:hypothetical protein [Polysiphonia elongata]ARW63418.1 hypothetical protein [Polysiphonia elongata]
MKKEIFLKKLDLLSISLEVLTTSNENKQIIKKFNTLYYNIRNKQYSKKQNFLFLIEYIYSIIKMIRKYSLDQLATKIIKGNNKFITRYISKFCYIYYRNKKYYINHKLILYKYNKDEKIAINNVAIINLYLICKLQKDQGIYTLIKYLKKL